MGGEVDLQDAYDWRSAKVTMSMLGRPVIKLSLTP